MNPWSRQYVLTKTFEDYITHLQRVATVRLAIYHLHDVLMNWFSRLITISPVVRSSNTIFANEEVLGIVYVFVGTRLNSVDNLEMAELAPA